MEGRPGPTMPDSRRAPVEPSAPVVTLLASTTSPAYDLVLLAHVLAALVGIVALGVAAGSALALRGVLRRGAPVPEALARYYRPGANWAGRVLFLVPVLGVVLLAMSGGQWGFDDTWVSVGMAAWAVVALAAEAVLWPGERELQLVVAAMTAGVGAVEVVEVVGADGADGGDGGDGGDGARAVPGAEPLPDRDAASARCVRIGLLGAALAVTLVAVGVVMVAKP